VLNAQIGTKVQIIKKSHLGFSELIVARRVTSRRRFSALTGLDCFAVAIATCGIGFIRVVPATFGSALGVGIYLLIGAVATQLHLGVVKRGWEVLPVNFLHLGVMLVAIITVSAAGVWAATRTEKVLGEKDPRPVIIDEIAGQLMTFLLVPFAASWLAVGAGFFLFRVFDILKPYPAHRLEHLKSGTGIMADDLVAGAYGALGLMILTSVLSSL
jgi:phosphatidylglycerophosphatase A